jgi:hypothetical protein
MDIVTPIRTFQHAALLRQNQKTRLYPLHFLTLTLTRHGTLNLFGVGRHPSHLY